MSTGLTLHVLDDELQIVRLSPDAQIPALNSPGFWSATRTQDELSIVCEASLAVPGGSSSAPWRCLKVEGPLPFELVGVLKSLADPLAQASVSIFAVSTFDTDYVLVKADALPTALAALRAAGHDVNLPET